MQNLRTGEVAQLEGPEYNHKGLSSHPQNPAMLVYLLSRCLLGSREKGPWGLLASLT